jgi:hypothetical protein
MDGTRKQNAAWDSLPPPENDPWTVWRKRPRIPGNTRFQMEDFVMIAFKRQFPEGDKSRTQLLGKAECLAS